MDRGANIPSKGMMVEHAEASAALLKGLANANRLLVLSNLARGEMSVSELNQCVKLSQSALSQHLAVLREQQLVRTRRESQTIYYSLADSRALDIIRLLARACDDRQSVSSSSTRTDLGCAG